MPEASLNSTTYYYSNCKNKNRKRCFLTIFQELGDPIRLDIVTCLLRRLPPESYDIAYEVMKALCAGNFIFY